MSVSEAQDLGITHSHRVIVDVRDRVSARTPPFKKGRLGHT